MDLNNHERRTWMPSYALAIQTISTLLVGIRFLSRVNGTGGRFGVDDVFIGIAWAIATVNIGLIIKFAYSFGLDRHIWDVAPYQWVPGAQYSFIIAGLFVWSSALTKIAILLFYRRLVAETASKKFKRAVWAGIIIIAAFSVVLFSLLFTACSTLEAHWLRLDPTYVYTHRGKFKCASVEKSQGIAQFGGAISVVTDFYTVALPAMLLFKVKMDRRQKIGLLGVFALGALVVISGIVRTIQLSKVQGFDFDKTWLGFNVFVAGIAEGNIGIICACAPSIKSCFRAYFRDNTAHIEMKSRQNSTSEECGLVSTAFPTVMKNRQTFASTDSELAATMANTGSTIRLSKESAIVSTTTTECRIVSSETQEVLGSQSPKSAESGGSIKVVEIRGSGAGPAVPEKDRVSQTAASRPSRVYFTITDEEALSPLSEFPMPPRTPWCHTTIPSAGFGRPLEPLVLELSNPALLSSIESSVGSPPATGNTPAQTSNGRNVPKEVAIILTPTSAPEIMINSELA
ncbi:hypothetical protein FKW77_007831 [Venturia effusa]|uniref:Rhodopsin domain-containing protein n=1 Tax=Venturia effusa TaxID=50376 RepID=A0A517KWV4_9PEZI|nr:hypothetical protein FKW77_007831 [Venturia effusa]